MYILYTQDCSFSSKIPALAPGMCGYISYGPGGSLKAGRPWGWPPTWRGRPALACRGHLARDPRARGPRYRRARARCPRHRKPSPKPLALRLPPRGIVPTPRNLVGQRRGHVRAAICRRMTGCAAEVARWAVSITIAYRFLRISRALGSPKYRSRPAQGALESRPSTSDRISGYGWTAGSAPASRRS